MARMKKALQQAAYNLEENKYKRKDRKNKKQKMKDFQVKDQVYFHNPAIRRRKFATKFYPK